MNNMREWEDLRDVQREELYSLMAAGSNDFLWRSVMYFSGISLSLKVLLSDQNIMKWL